MSTPGTRDFATEALLACYEGKGDESQQMSCAAQVVLLTDAVATLREAHERLTLELARLAIERARVVA